MKILITVILSLLTITTQAAQPLNNFLQEGKIDEGLVEFANPKDNAEKFSLGTLQVLNAIEKFSKGVSDLGINRETVRLAASMSGAMPSVLQSTNEATPEKVAGLVRGFKADLQEAGKTLSGIDDKEFKVEVNLSKFNVNLTGTNVLVMNLFTQNRFNQPQSPEDVIVRFDNADAVWLEGYTHFLVGDIDILSTYDWMPVWNQCAHVLFQNPKPAPPIVVAGLDTSFSFSIWVDVIAALHETRLKPVNPNGLILARDEFQKMIQCSRKSWTLICAETDNDHEWLPSPRQTGPRGSKVTQEQIDGWMHILDETEAILKGQKLLPHWRIKEGTGININKLVNNPPPFDLILMIQGSTFIPYLEKGEISDKVTWRNLTSPFGGGFFNFALWSN